MNTRAAKLSFYLILMATLVIVSVSMAKSIKYERNAQKCRVTGEGYNIVKQKGYDLFILFNQELMSGTDTAVMQVENAVSDLMSLGYRVKVMNSDYIPSADVKALEAKLDSLASSECKECNRDFEKY